MTSRIRYNRADINSTIEAARKISLSRTCYVFATCNGYTIGFELVSFQSYYKIECGKVEFVERVFGK